MPHVCHTRACTPGIIYDVIVEPPSIGTTVDEHGHSRPVAFMPYRVNGQYIMEGLAASFLFTIGSLGFVVLDKTHDPLLPRLNRILLISIGFLCILVSFFTTWIFMRMKLPYVSVRHPASLTAHPLALPATGVTSCETLGWGHAGWARLY